MGERGFHKRFQTVSCTNSLGFSMIKRTEIAQWLEKLWRKDQGQKTRSQRHTGIVVTKIQLAEIGKTKVDRHQSN
ncbi:Uncharacterised protein [Escherichia coli]|uniref:Uncharacterized protein n=1 Tax=Escherichia coli TaxID=562 RepID=A0A2X3KBT9_ECOLX|nr:Uncharacterised protein [Escherichia coli]